MKKILVGEDEKPLAKALQLKLTKSGYEVQNAYDGAAALEAVQKDRFDLILLDLVMPNTDGFKVLEELQKQNNATPVIVLSNLGQDEDMKRARSLGAKSFFIKASTPLAQIVSEVEKLLG